MTKPPYTIDQFERACEALDTTYQLDHPTRNTIIDRVLTAALADEEGAQ